MALLGKKRGPVGGGGGGRVRCDPFSTFDTEHGRVRSDKLAV